MKKCKKCQESKEDASFPLGENICKFCKNKAAQEKRIKKGIKPRTKKNAIMPPGGDKKKEGTNAN